MKPPIVVSEQGDVLIFTSIDDAARYLESPDVIENRYVAYDSEGRLLELKAQDKPSRTLLGIRTYSVTRPIRIEASENQPSHEVGLNQVLQSALERRGVSTEWLQNASRQDLLVAAIERLGYTR